MIVGVAASLIASMVWTAVLWIRSQGLMAVRVLLWLYVHGHSSLRISCASMICIENAGRYLLKDGNTRHGSYEPFGGVARVFDQGADELRMRGFRTIVRGGATVPGECLDLRGYIPRRRVLWFFRWIRKSEFIEEPTATAYRELLEELASLQFPHQVPLLSMRVCRQHVQPPWFGGNRDDPVARFFAIVKVRSGDEPSQALILKLSEWSETDTNVEWATDAELRSGRLRSTKAEVSNHSELLVSDCMNRADRAPAD